MKMTVLVPTYRRPQDVERCLKALQQQNCAADEVLAIVRDTDKKTHAFLQAFNPMTFPRRAVTVTFPGVIVVINAGFEAAAGEIIAIMQGRWQGWQTWNTVRSNQQESAL